MDLSSSLLFIKYGSMLESVLPLPQGDYINKF